MMKVLLVSAVPALGACSSFDTDSFKAPDSSTFFRPMSVTNVAEKKLPPVTAEEMVDAGGRCAAAAVAPPPDDPAAGGAEGAMAVVPGAIALEMTECDVVRRAGQPERVDIGTGDRNTRSVALTYIHGQQPGIYRFVEGRLKSMERAPEPEATRPTRKRQTRPARRSTSQSGSVTVQ